MNVGRVAKRGDRGQRGLLLHRGDNPKRIDARVVQVEDHQRWRDGAHRGERGVLRAGERHRHAELRRGRFDFQGEYQVVENC